MRRWVVIAALLIATRAVAAPGDRWDGTTVGHQFEGTTLGGLGGAAVLGIGGLVIGAVGHRHDSGPMILGAVIGTGVGLVIGAPLGAQLAGDRDHGTGRVWATGLGEVAGIAVTAGVVLIARATRDRAPRLAGTLGFVAICALLTGPVIGYQLSSDPRGTQALPRTTIIPLGLVRF
jgi:multisubunit Na+/H+ antiporter MnhG subunit